MKKEIKLTNELGRRRHHQGDKIKKTVGEIFGKKDSPVFFPKKRKFNKGKK